MIRNSVLTIFIFLIGAAFASGQTIQGKVIDSLKSEPIAFANIALEDGIRGTTSDIEGNFVLKVPVGYSGQILISHVSYQKIKLSIDYFKKSRVILLKPSVTVLSELTFTAEENPAFRIIRNAIANRDKHNPDNLKTYHYISYNKFLITGDDAPPRIDSLVQKLSNKERSKLSERQKTFLSFDSLLKTAHLFLSESVTEKKVKNPDEEKETLLALQISGFSSPLFTNMATDFQPFSFYRDKVTLLGKDYTNPITKGTFNRYDFYLTDTAYQEADTVYIIQFQPKENKLFNGLEGFVSVTTDGFAIKNVTASGADSLSLVDIRIQQKYEKVDGHWFPVQLNTDLDFSKLSFAGRGLKAQQRSFFKEIQINPDLKNNAFGDIKLELSKPKEVESRLLLEKYRAHPIDGKDARTYVFMDSTMKGARSFEKVMEALTTQVVPVGFLDIDLDEITRINKYEKFRLGVGLHTNDRFSKIIRLGGYYGYGFGDKQSKYGGDIKFTFNQNKDFFLRFSYENDIYETGTSHFNREGQLIRNEMYRNWVASQFDRTESYKGELGYRILPDIHATAFVSKNQINSTYNYNLIINGETKNRFVITEMGIALRYVKSETYFSLNGKKIFLNQKFPVVTFSLARAMTLLEAKDFDYTRYDLAIKHQIKHRTIGKSNLQIVGGWVDGIAPYGKLYNGRGASSTDLFVDGYFQTMGLYEFTTSQYASIFLNHNFGNVLLNRSFSKPELLLFHSMGVGTLQNSAAHQNIFLQSMDKGYVESGLGLNNLLRIKYVNVAYLGVGASAFYRYGPYQLPNMADNFAYRFNVSFSF